MILNCFGTTSQWGVAVHWVFYPCHPTYPFRSSKKSFKLALAIVCHLCPWGSFQTCKQYTRCVDRLSNYPRGKQNCPMNALCPLSRGLGRLAWRLMRNCGEWGIIRQLTLKSVSTLVLYVTSLLYAVLSFENLVFCLFISCSCILATRSASIAASSRHRQVVSAIVWASRARKPSYSESK